MQYAYDNVLQRYRCDIAYDGSFFHGWARQKTGVRTVCQELEERLSLIFAQNVSLTVAGRTDKGVHAHGQVAHVDLLPVPALENIDRLLGRCAKFLPADVRLIDFTPVPNTFDARFSALSRYYTYTINNSRVGPLPFDRNYVTHIPTSLNFTALNDASHVLEGLHDFAGFCRQRKLGKTPFGTDKLATTVRHLHQYYWTYDEQKSTYTAHLIADAFCWSMVRALVGAVVSVGSGKKTPLWLRELLARSHRCSDVPIFPAQGLSLMAVNYPPEQLYEQRAVQTRSIRTITDRDGTSIQITNNWTC